MHGKVLESTSSGDGTSVRACSGVTTDPFCTGTDAQGGVVGETGGWA